MEWQPIETAPATGLILLTVEGPDGERRTFAAEASHGDEGWHWLITTGWTGWRKLHQGWTPVSWARLPSPDSNARDPHQGGAT